MQVMRPFDRVDSTFLALSQACGRAFASRIVS